jgi:cell division protease FtsH
MRLPEGDRISMSRAKLNADLKVSMGGRLAEELIFGYDKVTTGASSDIKMATEIARRMVTEWGMSDVLGFQTYGENQREVFLGQALTQRQQISERTAELIDKEVQRILDERYAETRQLLESKLDTLHLMAQTLLDCETMSGEEIRALINEGVVPQSENAEHKMVPKSSIPDSGVEVEV